MNKKVLIISYYWPPAGGPGVQRWLKFVKYLPDFNIEPIVYVPDNPHYPIIDDKITSELPSDVTIIRKPIFEPYKLASLFSKKKTKTISSGLITTQKQSFVEKIMLYIRGNFFIPDARKYWIKPSVKFLKNYISNHKIDTIITTGPPHSLHLIGLELQKKANVKWFADFRDPWTTIGYHDKLKLSSRSKNKHKILERSVLQNANHIIVTSPTTKQEFKAITSQPIAVITNGFDDINFEKNIVLDTKFTLAHIGSLLTGRNPKVLWNALAELVQENTDFAEKFELKLIGAVSEDVLGDIQRIGLGSYLNVMGYVSHQEAQLEQWQSQLLLLVEIDRKETQCIIPGKLFEYMQSGRPIVAFGPNSADFKQIIKATNTGTSFNYDTEIAKVKEFILSNFLSFLKGNLKAQGLGIQQYHRKELTRSLVSTLLE